jgi:hypothetical protein
VILKHRVILLRFGTKWLIIIKNYQKLLANWVLDPG